MKPGCPGRSENRLFCVESPEEPGDGSEGATWTVVATAGGGGGQSRRHVRVLGGEVSSGRRGNRTRCEQFALLRAAYDAGVRVLRPLALCEDAGVLGAPFLVTDFDWETETGKRPPGDYGDSAGIPEHSPSPRPQPVRVVHRSSDRGRATEQPMPSDARPRPDAVEKCGPDAPSRGGWLRRPELAAQLGRELATLHRITPPHPGLGFLDPEPDDLSAERIDGFRERLDAMGDPQPLLEWVMRQLERNAPESAGTVLCHGPPRAGVRLADDRGALATLEWDGWRWGDPHEDIGEFCAECRRYFAGRPQDGSGAARVGFLDGYRDLSGLDVNENLVRYWEVMATLGRAVCSLEHGHRFAAGGERAVELALTGRRVAEFEIDLLAETDRLAMERAHA